MPLVSIRAASEYKNSFDGVSHAHFFPLQATGRGHQKVVLRVNYPAVVANARAQIAYASVCELNGALQPFIGDARMYVCNIAPTATYVDIWIQIDWSSDLAYQVDVLMISRN